MKFEFTFNIDITVMVLCLMLFAIGAFLLMTNIAITTGLLIAGAAVVWLMHLVNRSDLFEKEMTIKVRINRAK